MKKLIYLSVILYLFYGQCFGGSKIDKIGFVNIDRIIKETFSERSLTLQKLKQDEEEVNRELQKMKEEIYILQNKLTKIANSDKSTRRNLESQIEEKKIEYTNYYKIKTNYLESQRKNYREPFLRDIYQAVRLLAEREGYTAVFNIEDVNLIYYLPENDITDMVIQKLIQEEEQ